MFCFHFVFYFHFAIANMAPFVTWQGFDLWISQGLLNELFPFFCLPQNSSSEKGVLFSNPRGWAMASQRPEWDCVIVGKNYKQYILHCYHWSNVKGLLKRGHSHAHKVCYRSLHNQNYVSFFFWEGGGMGWDGWLNFRWL